MTPNPAETLPALQSQPLLQQAAPSQFFGDPTGPQMAALGQGLVSAARTATYLQDKLDESQARDMTIELSKTQSSLLVDPDKGFLWTKGQNALGARPQALEQFNSRVQELEEQLQTRRAKQLFRQQAGLRQIEFQQRIDAHAGREAEEYETQSRAAALDQYAQEAIDSYGLPGIAVPDPQNPGAMVGGQPNATSEVRAGLALREFDAMAQAKGIPQGSPLYQQLRTAVTNKIAVGITEKLMAQDPAKAWQYLQNVQAKDMTSEDRRRLFGQVQEHADTAIGISTASKLLQDFQDPEVAQQQLRNIMLAKPGALTPAAFDRARQEIKLQGDAAETQRKQFETRVFEEAKAVALQNPQLTFDGLPAPIRQALENSFQRDDFESWLSKERKTETNPVVAAGLAMQPASWWKSQDLARFARDYQRHLAPNDFERFAKLIGIGPEAENQVKVKELDLMAAQDAGFVAKDEDLSDDPEKAAKFLRFQARVDQLAASVSEDERDPAAARAKARTMALAEKMPDGNYRWDLTPEQRAQTKIKIEGYDDEIDVSRGFGGVSRSEVDAVVAGLAMENPRRGQALQGKLAMLRQQAADNPSFANDAEREMAAQEGLKADLLMEYTETDVVKKIVERRKAAAGIRAAERESTSNEVVSWETLQRQGIIKSKEDELERILSGRSLAALDDIATPKSSQRSGRFDAKLTDDLAGTFGLSRASVNRMLAAHKKASAAAGVAGQVLGLPGRPAQATPQDAPQATPAVGVAAKDAGLMSPQDKKQAILRFERMLAMSSAEQQQEQSQQEQLVAAIEQRLATQGDSKDPRMLALLALNATASVSVGPSKQDAEMAWEAWLQSGGDEWERWEAGGKTSGMPVAFARREFDGRRSSFMPETGYAMHKEFRRKIAKVLGRNPSAPAGQ